MTPLESILSNISALDTSLDIARQAWLDARDNDTKRKYRVMLDQFLDQRLTHMKERDRLVAEAEVTKPRSKRVRKVS